MAQALANFTYVGPISKRDLPARIVDEWEATLKGARARILASLSRFLDPQAGLSRFLDQIADASSDAWEAFVNPSWPNAGLIKLKQRIKLAGAYNDWRTGVQNAFAPNGTFETNVTAKKPKFATGIPYVVGAVGFKPDLNWGPASKAALIVTGDMRVVRYITAGEQFQGTPANMFPVSGNFVRPMIISTYTFGSVLGLYAKEAGIAVTDILNYTNTLLNEIKKLAKTCAAGGSFTMELRDDPTLGLHVYVSAVNC